MLLGGSLMLPFGRNSILSKRQHQTHASVCVIHRKGVCALSVRGAKLTKLMTRRVVATEEGRHPRGLSRPGLRLRADSRRRRLKRLLFCRESITVTRCGGPMPLKEEGAMNVSCVAVWQTKARSVLLSTLTPQQI